MQTNKDESSQLSQEKALYGRFHKTISPQRKLAYNLWFTEGERCEVQLECVEADFKNMVMQIYTAGYLYFDN